MAEQDEAQKSQIIEDARIAQENTAVTNTFNGATGDATSQQAPEKTADTQELTETYNRQAQGIEPSPETPATTVDTDGTITQDFNAVQPLPTDKKNTKRGANMLSKHIQADPLGPDVWRMLSLLFENILGLFGPNRDHARQNLKYLFPENKRGKNDPVMEQRYQRIKNAVEDGSIRNPAKMPEFISELMDSPLAQEVREMLVEREGYRSDIYYDSLGHLTVGYGHLITEQDRALILKVTGQEPREGLELPKEILDELFDQDAHKAMEAAMAQARELGLDPQDGSVGQDFAVRLSSVNFQLGTAWRDEWKNTWADIKSGNYQSAIGRVERSLWDDQTPKRTEDFIQGLRNLQAHAANVVQTPTPK